MSNDRSRKPLIITVTSVVVVAALAFGMWALVTTLGGSIHFADKVAVAALSKTPTPTPTPTYKVGDIAPAEAAASLPPSYVLYQLSNGSNVVVGGKQPLPAAVQADIQAKVATLPSGVTSDPQASAQAVLAERSLVDTISIQTDKTVIMIAPFRGTLDPGRTPVGTYWGSFSMSGDYTPHASASEAETEAHVQSFIAQSGQSADSFLMLVKQQ